MSHRACKKVSCVLHAGESWLETWVLVDCGGEELKIGVRAKGSEGGRPRGEQKGLRGRDGS